MIVFTNKLKKYYKLQQYRLPHGPKHGAVIAHRETCKCNRKKVIRNSHTFKTPSVRHLHIVSNVLDIFCYRKPPRQTNFLFRFTPSPLDECFEQRSALQHCTTDFHRDNAFGPTAGLLVASQTSANKDSDPDCDTL